MTGQSGDDGDCISRTGSESSTGLARGTPAENRATRVRTAEPLSVLVVEDNPGDVRLIREAIDGSDVDSSLTAVTDGETALEHLLGRADAEASFDLVLLDLNVPKVDGKTVLERLDDDPDGRSAPVAIFSSSESRDDVVETYELGADGYFVKPVDPTAFLSVVERLEEAAAGAEGVPPGEFSELDRTP